MSDESYKPEEGIREDMRLPPSFQQDFPLTSQRLDTSEKVDKFFGVIYALINIRRSKEDTRPISIKSLATIVETILRGHYDNGQDIVKLELPNVGESGPVEEHDFRETFFPELKSTSGGSDGYTFSWK